MNKSHIVNQLIDAKKELENLIQRLSEQEKGEPEGFLSCKINKSIPQFYCGKTYLGKDRQNLIKALAQKRYNRTLKEATENEARQMEKCLEILSKTHTDAQQILQSLPEPMRPLVNTDVLTDEKLVEKWEKQYPGDGNPKKTEIEYTTANGEKVKSKSEVIIADRLKFYNVPYFYEKPVALPGLLSNFMDFPDFTCLNRRTGKTYYLEHCGRFDDPSYTQRLMFRIIRFSKLGIDLGSELLLTMETQKFPLDTEYLDRLIERYLI